METNKVRVHELAKKLGVSNKDLIEKLKNMGVKVGNHMSNLESSDVLKVTSILKPESKQLSERKDDQPILEKSSAHDAEQKNKKQEKIQPRAKNEVDEQQEAKTSPKNITQKPQATNRQQNSNQQHSSQQHSNQQSSNQQHNNQQSSTQQYSNQRQQNNQQQQNYQQHNNQQQSNQQSSQQGNQQGNQQSSSQQQRNPNRQQNQRQQGSSQQNSTYQQRSTGYQQNPQRQQGTNQQQGANRQQRPQNSGPYTGQQNSGQQGSGQQGSGQQGSGQYQRTPGYQQRPQNSGYQQRPQQGAGQGTGQQRTSQGAGQQKRTDVGKRPPGQKADFQKPVKPEVPQKHEISQKHQIKQELKNKQQNNFKDFDKSADQKKKNIKTDKADKMIDKNVAMEAKEPEEPKIITIPESLTVRQLAEHMSKNAAELVKTLFKKGIMASVNQEIDFETAGKIAEQFNTLVEKEIPVDVIVDIFKQEEDSPESLKERPPIVVVMGHVDHGKTSLLDAIRKTTVTKNEAGGITQHIGAYTVKVNDKNITFLDTPGHEAFTAMRMRGALVTDIAILVVAADDGVMPQTVEAINHAKAAGVEIIVAINKIDKPSANPDRVKQELVEYGLLSEDWGGETIFTTVSAISREGIDTLLEMILLASEMKELRANPNKGARGTVIEAKLEKGRGTVATVLVQSGTLYVGDPIVCGSAHGRIRAMTDDKGRRLKEAGPSIPVEILGLAEVPLAGDKLYVALNEKQARQAAEYVYAQGREEMIKSTPQKVSLDDLFSQIQSGNMKELNLVIKADVQGSVEAVKQSLEKLSNEEVRIRTLHGGVGAITESDVMLASTSNAIIIGFNVRPEAGAKSMAEEQKVDLRLYRVIYNAIEDITTAMKGMLDPIYEEKVLGHAEIRQIFKASGIGTIGGAHITDGKFIRSAKVRIVRDGVVVYEGELDSLKRFKDDVKEVMSGYECGLVFKKFNDLKELDKVEAFVMEEIKR